MNKMIVAMFLVLAPVHGYAEGTGLDQNAHVVKTATDAGGAEYNYILMGLKALAFSQYSMKAPDRVRQYLKFKNEDGYHYIIYEEAKSAPPLRELVNLKQSIENQDVEYTIEFICKQKAFCTGDCSKKYYEITNAPGNDLFSKSNKCRLNYYSYSRKQDIELGINNTN